MKKLTFLFTLVLFTLGLASCKKFLQESSQDELIPKSIEDLSALMYSDAYPYSFYPDTYTDLLSDDIQSNGIPQQAGTPISTYVPYQAYGAPVYTWDPSMFDNITGTTGTNVADQSGVNSWTLYYNKIKGCNVVLDYVNQVSGSVQAKNAVRGQVLFLRAFYYLKLVTLYGQPYSGSGIDPQTSLGVPLVLSSKVSDTYPARNTLAEVYAQVETDLLSAADLLKNNYTAPSLFRVGHLAAYTLLSRLYLYQGRDADMDKVITYVNQALAIKSTLTPLTNYVTSATAFSTAGIYDQTLSSEVIWSYGTNPYTSNNTFIPQYNSFNGAVPPFTVSNSLLSLYDKGNGTSSNYGDLRYKIYFQTYYLNGTYYPLRSGKIGTTQKYGDRGMRVAELYLNRAEAYARKYMSSGQGSYATSALADINYLRQSRWDTRNQTYNPVNITDAKQLFAFLQDERRRELCLEENFRWNDIKRWGVAVTRSFTDASGVTTNISLPAAAKIYALPIPYDVMGRNYNLKQNLR